MIGMTVFVFRSKGLGDEKAWKSPLYPVLPLVFICSSLFMVYRSVSYLDYRMESEDLLGNPFFVFLISFTALVAVTSVGVAIWSRKTSSRSEE